MPVNNIIEGTASGVVLDVDTNSVGNIGGGEDDLIVSTIPANTLDVDHKYIHFSASGRFATSVSNKQLRAYFGSTKIFDSGSLAITTASDWILEGWIIRISATSEHALVKFESSSSVLLASALYSTPAEDLTTQVVLKCTGAGTSDNDITQTDLIVDVNNGGTGLGDVSGPSSSIDGHFVSFNGTTGKVIRDGIQPTTLANDLLWSAKGQLAVGVGSATGTVLAVGTDDYVLVAASGQPSGLKWAANNPGIIIYDDGVYKNTGTAISFDSNLSVIVSGSVAYVSASGGGASSDGWNDKTAETWTYASASTFTVSGDQTAIYQKGTKLKFTQTTVKYAVVLSSSYSNPNTTVTIITNTDYTIANAAISNNYYSYIENPAGFPDWFAYAVTWSNGNNSLGNGTLLGRYAVKGKMMSVFIHLTMGSSTTYGTGGAYLWGLPVTTIHGWMACHCYDSSAFQGQEGGNVSDLASVTTFAITGANLYWDQTHPYSWSTGDVIHCGGVVEF